MIDRANLMHNLNQHSVSDLTAFSIHNKLVASEAIPQTDEDWVGRIALAPSDSLASPNEMSDSAGARSDLLGVIEKI